MCLFKRKKKAEKTQRTKAGHVRKKEPMVVALQFEFLASPIWPLDELGILTVEPAVIEKDEISQKLANEIRDMFNGYYEFDIHGVACWFNEEQEKQDKDKMLSLLAQLVDRLNEINDGSYVIEDRETDRVRAL